MKSKNFEDFGLGDTYSLERCFKADDLEQFIHLSQDNHPLHASATSSKEAGFSGTILHGALTNTLYSALIGASLRGRNAVIMTWTTEFKAPAHINQKLVAQGRISNIFEAVKVLEVKATIRNQHNVLVSKATIKVKFL